MRPFWLAAIMATVVVFLAPGPAAALGPCETRANLIAALAERYREIPVALGVTSAGSLVEVLQNAAGETWTIIVTSPQGMSCLVFSGDGWREQRHPPVEPGA
jgi:cyanophycinase-like exopeptidase